MTVNAFYLYRRYSKELIGKFNYEELMEFLQKDYKKYCKEIKKAFPKKFEDNGGIVKISDSSIYNAIRKDNEYGILLKHYYISRDTPILEFNTEEYNLNKIKDYVNKNYKELRNKCRKAVINMTHSNDYNDDLLNDAIVYTMEQMKKNGAVNNIEATIVGKVKFYILDKYRRREKESFLNRCIINESKLALEDVKIKYEDYSNNNRIFSDEDAYFELFNEEGYEIQNLDERLEFINNTIPDCDNVTIYRSDSEIDDLYDDVDLSDPYVVEFLYNIKNRK